jgi:hypothetical protein
MSKHRFVRRTLAVACVAALIGATSAHASAPARVVNGDDSGPGSLRAALESGSAKIFISPSVERISIESTLTYAGSQPLLLRGSGQVIEPADEGSDFTLLEVSEGANLTVENLNFQGSGGFDLDNAGTGKGIFVRVPDTRSGVVRLSLSQVRVADVANHGVHISDCSLGDDCGGGSGGGGEGSNASIHAILDRVTVDGAGNGKFDADGLRIDERADGDILLDLSSSSFINVGADGIELDEGNNGDVWVNVRDVFLADNGAYCLNAPLDLAEPCVEDDDGELVLDLDDGFDIDEAGDGSLQGRIISAIVVDNLDEGLDFDEEGPGGMQLEIWRTYGAGNGDEAIKLSAAEGGNIFADLRNTYALGNGNDGIQIENEDGDGQTHLEVPQPASPSGNDGDGLQVSQENGTERGTLVLLRGYIRGRQPRPRERRRNLIDLPTRSNAGSDRPAVGAVPCRTARTRAARHPVSSSALPNPGALPCRPAPPWPSRPESPSRSKPSTSAALAPAKCWSKSRPRAFATRMPTPCRERTRRACSRPSSATKAPGWCSRSAAA